MPEFKYAGTVSHGTLRNQDLFTSFMRVLEELNPEKAKTILKNSDKVFDPDTEEGSELVQELTEALESEAPEGYWFGTHPGDGSDFGF